MRDAENRFNCIAGSYDGHFVLATLHTNDSASSVIRLLDMGAESYIVASVLRAVMAQRLVRRMCPHCAKPHELNLQEKNVVNGVAPNLSPKILNSMKGRGAPIVIIQLSCQIGIYELLEIDQEWQMRCELIIQWNSCILLLNRSIFGRWFSVVLIL